MSHHSRITLWTGSAIAALSASTTAMAQDPAAAAEDPMHYSEVIIIQALKQNKTLLDTPATVSIIAQEELTTSNITSARDLGGIVPGFTFMQGTAGGSASFRGLGSNSADPAIESSVGGFNDGIYLGHSRDFTTPLYDLQQIEFVAGTQSTLLGKNTSLGAVSITSRRPGSDFSVDGSATYTTEIDAITLRAGMDIPLGSTFAVRLAGFFEDDQGFTRNRFIDRDEQKVQDISGRAVLEGDISNSVRLTAIYQHDSRRAKGQDLELLNDPDGLAAFFSEALLGLPPSLIDTTADDATVNGSERLNPADPAAPLPYDDQDSDRATAIFDIATAGGGMLTAQTGYLNWNSARRLDQDYTPALILDLIDNESNEVFSQELRFRSPSANALTYLLGVYYYHNNYSLRRQIASDLGEDLDGFSRIETNSFSAFASGRYRFGENFSVLAGIRHNMEDKRATYDISGTLAIPIGPVTVSTDTNHETDYNFGVEFNSGPDLLLYATYARGSKNGGFQSVPDDLEIARYGPEVAKSIELGAKYDLGGGSSLEFAAFDTHVEDFQASRLITAPGFPIPLAQIANVDARTTGAEGKFRWSLSREFGISASLTYADARFTEGLQSEVAPGVFITEIADGMRLVRAPRWSGKFAFDYATSISDSLEFSANGVMRYQSEADLQFRASNPSAPIQQEHATIDLELRLGNPNGKWWVAAIGNNLTDVRFTNFTSDWLLAGFIDPLATPPYYGRRNRPRTFSMQLGFEF